MTAFLQRRLPDPEFEGWLARFSPDLLIHCAGRASVPLSMTDPSTDFHSNTAATFETLNALRKSAPHCRFVLLSSAAVYGNPSRLPVNESAPPSPLSPYGFHKWQCEQLCVEFARVYGMKTVSARLFSAYGEGLQRQVMWDICRKALNDPVVQLQGTGRETRDFLHASDIALGLEILAQKAPMNGETYNLASGRQTEIAALANRLLDALSAGVVTQFDGRVPPGNPLRWQADISSIANLGFAPEIPWDRGVDDYAAWCRSMIHSS